MSGYLLDTNALSESNRRQPDSGYMTWLGAIEETELYTSCLVVGEVFKGVDLAKDGVQRRKLEVYFQTVVEFFDGRVLALDMDVCLVWSRLFADAQKNGKTPPYIDSFLAAQAIYHDLTLVTRNTKDVEQFKDLRILNPWQK